MATLSRWLLFTWVFFISSPSFSATFSSEYDAEIQRATNEYWPDLDEWTLWKAQLIQESGLNPTICSKAGACGLAQFMEITWRDVLRELHWDGAISRGDAEMAIEAGAYYQGKLRRSWNPKNRTGLDRHDLGLAAYNAGLGSVIKAQRTCNEAVLWPDIAPCMKAITGEANAKQTRDYVTNIHKWFGMMEAAP